MNDNTTLEYGPVHADELDQLNNLLEQALTFPIGTMAPWTAAIGHEHMRAVRRDGRAVAGMSIIPIGHYFGGQCVRAGGITAVGVAPEQRGSGVGRWMLQQSLEELHRQGVPLATLYPATTAFYRRTGFERAAQRLLYDVPLAGIGVRDYSLEAVPAGPDDYATIKQLYAQQARRTSAFMDRPEFYWNSILEPKDKRVYTFIVQRDGVPEGYVSFSHASWGETLKVNDIVSLTPAAGRRLLTLLADHRSMTETMRLPGAPNDPLLFLMPEQKQKVGSSLDLMLRIVDLVGALSARGYPAGVSAELQLDLRDEVLPWNNGRFVLTVADRRARVRSGGSGQFSLHVRDLATLYSGYMTPHELLAAGSLEGSEADLAIAAQIFAGPRPWTPDMF
ncbi:MAG: GNAT family N-acetyltransferase [Roseiflexaceae bacterium]